MKLLLTLWIFMAPFLSMGIDAMSGAVAKYDCKSCNGKNEIIFYRDLTFRRSYTHDVMKFVVTTGTYTFVEDTLVLSADWSNHESIKPDAQKYIFKNNTLTPFKRNGITDNASFSESGLNGLLGESDSKINKQSFFRNGMSKLERVQRAIINTDSVYVGHAVMTNGGFGKTTGEIAPYIDNSFIAEMEAQYYYNQWMFILQIRSLTANFIQRLPDTPEMIMPAAFTSTTYEIGFGYNFLKAPGPAELILFGTLGRTSFTHETVGWHRQRGNLTSVNAGLKIGYNFLHARNRADQMVIPVGLKIGYFQSGYQSAYDIKGANLYAGLSVGFRFNGYKPKYAMPH